MKKATKNRNFGKVVMGCAAFFLLWGYSSLKNQIRLQQHAQQFQTEAEQTAHTVKPMQIKLHK